MKTGELIRALAADNNARAMAPGQALSLALIPSAAIAFGLMLAVLGLRPHLLALLGEPRLTFKLGLMLLLALLSGPLALHLAKPGLRTHAQVALLTTMPLLLAAAVAAELFAVPRALWGERLIGSNALHCLESIPFLAAVPLAGILLALRQGAPEHPALAGAAAGLFAGAIGAFLYAAHCPDDSPFFVAAWYSLAIAIVAAAGALAGRRLLRW